MKKLINWIKEKIKWILLATGIIGISLVAGLSLPNDGTPIDNEVFGATPFELKLDEISNQLAIVQIAASDINEILVKTREAILIDKEGERKIDLTSTQKQLLLDEYNIRKQKLIDAVNVLNLIQ